MRETINRHRKTLLLASAAAVLGMGLPLAAEATPYAFASNQITGLTLTGNFTPLGTATTSATATANYAGAPGVTSSRPGTVGSALDINAAAAGSAPSTENVFTPLGAGAFGSGGARGDASIGAGSVSTGGVSVSNVAEATGSSFGDANGQNTSTINFELTGGGSAVTLALNNLVQLIASTDALTGESANATISNLFEVRNAANTVVFTYQPEEINVQTSSAGGIPPTATNGPSSFFLSATTSVLDPGQNYTISLRSSASATITAGTPTPVPEPGTLGLLGFGLASLGLLRRRRRA